MNGNKHISSAGNGRKEWTNKSFTTKEKYIIPKELCIAILDTISVLNKSGVKHGS
jgi:hypothetical protein